MQWTILSYFCYFKEYFISKFFIDCYLVAMKILTPPNISNRAIIINYKCSLFISLIIFCNRCKNHKSISADWSKQSSISFFFRLCPISKLIRSSVAKYSKSRYPFVVNRSNQFINKFFYLFLPGVCKTCVAAYFDKTTF